MLECVHVSNVKLTRRVVETTGRAIEAVVRSSPFGLNVVCLVLTGRDSLGECAIEVVLYLGVDGRAH
jgi:electron transfer flavoprotein alpha/beta subunit